MAPNPTRRGRARRAIGGVLDELGVFLAVAPGHAFPDRDDRLARTD
jgi:hypothetical protein